MKFFRQNIIADAWAFLTKRQRKVSLIMAAGFVLTSVMEVVALSATAIFVSALLDPDSLGSNRFVTFAAGMLGNPPADELVTMLGVASAFLLFAGLGIGFFMQVLISFLGVRMSCHMVNRYSRQIIYAPYSWIARQSAPRMAQRLFTDPSTVGLAVFPSALELLYAGLLTIVGIAVIAAAAPWNNLIAIAGLVALNAVIFTFVRPLLRRYAEQQRVSAMECTKLGMEVITGAKEVQVKSRQEHFIGLYDQSYLRYSMNRMKMALIQKLMPILFMLLGQTSLIAIALMMHNSDMSRGEIAGYMALLVVIVGRLLPLISRTAGTFGKLATAIPYIDALKAHFAKFEGLENDLRERRRRTKVDAGWRTMTLHDVTYAYPEAKAVAVSGVSLEIKRGLSYGLAGRSGAGKTTLMDLIIGLYNPQSGAVRIDGKDLFSFDPRSWHKRIGYVPQTPFISNDTLRRNVSFGLPDRDIDDDRVRYNLERAGMKDVLASLEDGLDTMLGDNGLRLSGGQRQRVAIARALYDEPDLLIMDEATSALDTLTEKAIQETIQSLQGDVTTITIAHRLSTITGCDRIFLIDGGTLAASGSYDELLMESPLFKELAAQKEPSTAAPDASASHNYSDAGVIE